MNVGRSKSAFPLDRTARATDVLARAKRGGQFASARPVPDGRKYCHASNRCHEGRGDFRIFLRSLLRLTSIGRTAQRQLLVSDRSEERRPSTLSVRDH